MFGWGASSIRGHIALHCSDPPSSYMSFHYDTQEHHFGASFNTCWCETYITKLSILKDTKQGHLNSYIVGQPSLLSSSKTFQSLWSKTSSSLSSFFPIFPPFSPLQILIYILSFWILSILDILYKWNKTWCDLLYPSYSFPPFYGWITFHCII